MRIYVGVCLLCSLLVCSCGQQNKVSSIRTLPMDSSLAIIMEATGLLSDSCVPLCWQRDFSMKKMATHYRGYILQGRPDQRIQGIHPPIRLGSDSSFYPLIDYACTVELQPIRPEDVELLSDKRVDVQATNSLHGILSDNELGYITVSPVTIDQGNSRVVFFYELRGDGHSSLMVRARRKQNRWMVASRELLSIQ